MFLDFPKEKMTFYQHKITSVKDLIPYALNSRTHSDEQVAQLSASIREFGFTNPVLIDDRNNLIAGHGRVLAARKLKMDTVPAIVVTGLDDRKRRALVIADNKLALNADWDIDALQVELEDLAGDFGELMGFSQDELVSLLHKAGEGLTDDDEVPEAKDNPVAVPGDIWTLGKHRLMCGDATSIDQLELLCENQLVDMWLTDPPYNVAYEGKTADALVIKNDEMSATDFRQFLADSYTAADAVMKAGSVYYIWHADSEGYNFRGAAHDIGWTIRQCLIWKKQSMVMGRQDYHWQHEPCLYGWKDGAAHVWAADRKQTTTLNFDRPNRNAEHPTMKPVEPFEYQMLNNTKGDDLVLDSFGGSGTIAIACEKHGRRARMMELDLVYCDVIINRWQEYTGQQAVHVESGKTYFEMTNAVETKISA
jgi:DNA modification methylase